MGNSQPAPVKEEDLAKMKQKYFLSRSEILKLYKFWESLGLSYYEEPNVILSSTLIEKVSILSINPWAQRICFIFASVRDPLSGLCALTFDDLLTLANAFHFRTPREIKFYWAFKLYDFDNDDSINESDAHLCVRTVVGSTMSDKEIAVIVQRVFSEIDMNGNKDISMQEFALFAQKYESQFHHKFTFNILS